MHRQDKSKSMDIHVINRFKERFNFKATKEDIDHIVHMIKSNEKDGIEPIYKQSNTRTVWKIKYKDLEFLAIYHKDKHRLCTVMPLDWLKTLSYTAFGRDCRDGEDSEIGLLTEERNHLLGTIESLDAVLDQMNYVHSEEVICFDSEEVLTKDDIEVCRQILDLIANSSSLEISGLQTDNLVI